MAAPWRFLPCPSCCEACEYFSDGFTRSDAPNPGANYTVVTGSWPIVSNTLSVSSDNAVVVCDTLGDDNEVTVIVKLTSGSKGDQLRVIVDYVDSNNYWFVEFEAGDVLVNNAVVRIYERVAGANNLRASYAAAQFSPGDTITAYICFSSVVLNANYTPPGGSGLTPLVSYPATATTSKCGLGTGSRTAAVTFDDFRLSAHYDNNDKCTQCGMRCTACEDNQNAERMQVVISNMVNVTGCGWPDVCADLEGTYILPPRALNPCWHQIIASYPCVVNTIYVHFWWLVNNICDVNLVRAGAARDILFQKTQVAQFDCDGLINEDIPYLPNLLGGVDQSPCSGTCALTSL